MTTTDPFTEAMFAASRENNPHRDPQFGEFRAGAEWARTHLAAQRAEEVRDWAVQQYPSGTPLDQDRRMVAAETEAYLSGRTEREMSELAQAAKHAGPVDPPAQEPTDVEVEAAARALAYWDGADRWATPEYDGEIPESAYRHGARKALSAARAARRDEEKRDG